ncbi:hypothetical protein GUJ93_ZPchr0015g6602 [Zizania palustris]|uniref:Uncharacterized protein n=1 Tax=Zizania palustris TaxID=103762 RepID=A0A8J5VSY8_ZIZPA|nr:hypothetical protein GUJ93_ZPchr0015g6602 [Zizania palustris]
MASPREARTRPLHAAQDLAVRHPQELAVRRPQELAVRRPQELFVLSSSCSRPPRRTGPRRARCTPRPARCAPLRARSGLPAPDLRRPRPSVRPASTLGVR